MDVVDYACFAFAGLYVFIILVCLTAMYRLFVFQSRNPYKGTSLRVEIVFFSVILLVCITRIVLYAGVATGTLYVPDHIQRPDVFIVVYLGCFILFAYAKSLVIYTWSLATVISQALHSPDRDVKRATKKNLVPFIVVWTVQAFVTIPILVISALGAARRLPGIPMPDIEDVMAVSVACISFLWAFSFVVTARSTLRVALTSIQRGKSSSRIVAAAMTYFVTYCLRGIAAIVDLIANKVDRSWSALRIGAMVTDGLTEIMPTLLVAFLLMSSLREADDALRIELTRGS